MKREVKEETGLDVNLLEYIDKYEYFADNETRKSTQYNYLCSLKGDQKIKLSKEHSEYKWITSVGEAELLVPSEMKKTISKVLINKTVIYQDVKEVIKETQKSWEKNENIKSKR
jgi:8-oxo-dGTP pyrophosphatase MutT (NUDIX family)